MQHWKLGDGVLGIQREVEGLPNLRGRNSNETKMVYASFKRNAVVVRGTLYYLFLQCLFLQCCNCLCKIFWEGTGFETSHSLILLYSHTESWKCWSHPSTGCYYGYVQRVSQGCSAMTQRTSSAGGCAPHIFCILLRLVTSMLVLEVLFHTFWGLLVISQFPHPALPLWIIQIY